MMTARELVCQQQLTILKKKKTIPTMQTYKRRNFKQEKTLVKRTDQ